MSKKIPQDDLDYFNKAMTGTKRLITNKIRLKTRKPVTQPSQFQKKHETLISEKLLLPDPVTADEKMSYKHPGISHKILRNLGKGQYNVEAKLDLHGLTVDQAKQTVDQFLQNCYVQHVRVALIIHGKSRFHEGLPILKNKLNHWLRSVDIVLAFCSASTQHGSRGAVYVLLKKDIGERAFEKE